MRTNRVFHPLVMHTTTPPTLETFSHWPSWLNAYGNLDRSACFELRVSQVRRLAGCIPTYQGYAAKRYRAQSRAGYGVPDLPNERPAVGHAKLISKGHYDITADDLDWLARQQFPRRLAGDWRTARAPAMRPENQQLYAPPQQPKQPEQPVRDADLVEVDECCDKNKTDDAEQGVDVGPGGGSEPGGRRPPAIGAIFGMSLEQGGHGPGERAYERKLVCMNRKDAFDENPAKQRLPAPASMEPGMPIGDLDAGLDGNPNRGATREKRFGIDFDWTQRLEMQKHRHASVSGVQYFLVCPGSNLAGQSCGKTAYKLFWVLGRAGEHRDAQLAEQWIASLTSSELARCSAQVSALVDRYGPIMGDDRKLRCRHCLDMKYGKSPEASRINNARRKRGRKRRKTHCN